MLVNEAKSLEIASMNFIILFQFYKNVEKILLEICLERVR